METENIKKNDFYALIDGDVCSLNIGEHKVAVLQNPKKEKELIYSVPDVCTSTTFLPMIKHNMVLIFTSL